MKYDTLTLAPLSGRLFLSRLPGYEENTVDAFRDSLVETQADVVICLVPREEINKKAPTYMSALTSKVIQVPVIEHGILEYGIPTDVAAFSKLVFQVKTRLQSGQKVWIHCASGHGRTGIFAGCVLRSLGYTGYEMMDMLEPCGPKTRSQTVFLDTFQPLTALPAEEPKEPKAPKVAAPVKATAPVKKIAAPKKKASVKAKPAKAKSPVKKAALGKTKTKTKAKAKVAVKKTPVVAKKKAPLKTKTKATAVKAKAPAKKAAAKKLPVNKAKVLPKKKAAAKKAPIKQVIAKAKLVKGKAIKKATVAKKKVVPAKVKAKAKDKSKVKKALPAKKKSGKPARR